MARGLPGGSLPLMMTMTGGFGLRVGVGIFDGIGFTGLADFLAIVISYVERGFVLLSA